MKGNTMVANKLGATICVAMLGAVWLGCANDAAPAGTGPEPVGTTKEALGAPLPDCDKLPWNKVEAIPHTGAYNPLYAPSKYTVSADYGGQNGANYMMPCGPEDNDTTGDIVTCGSDPNLYEKKLWETVARSNGYAYFVYATVGKNSGSFMAVGINSSTADPSRSYTPPQPPGHARGGSPTTGDWSAEQSLVASGIGQASDVEASYIECALVVAADTGQTLDFFPVLDVHDPRNPPW